MDDYSSFKPVETKETSARQTRAGVRRGGTARELQMARAMGQQVPFTPAPVSGDSSGAAFMTGVGRGASLGLSDYLAALGIQGTRAMTGGAPVTFQEALGDVRGFTQQMREQSPLAYGAGQMVGSVGGPGAAAAKLVSRAPKLGTIAGITGTGAVTGGVSGFTEGEDLGQAAIGAGLGAATGGLVGGAFQGSKRLVDKLAREDAARSIETLLRSKQQGNKEILEDIFGVTDKQLRAEGTTVFKEGKNLVDALRSGEMPATSIPKFVSAARQLSYKPLEQHVMNIGEAGLRGAGGAGIGLGLSALSGGVIPPALAAAGIGLYGAKEAGGRAAIDITRQGLSKMATQQRMPLVQERMLPGGGVGIMPTPSATGAGITGAVSPMMGSMIPAQPEDYSAFQPIEEVPMPAAPASQPLPRLRQLAEEFRQRTGGQ